MSISAQTPRNSDWQAAGEALTRDGITTAPILFAAEADYLRRAYIEGSVAPQVPRDRGTILINPDRAAASGSFAWAYISLADPVLDRLLLDPDLLSTIESYYGCQPFLRRMPYVKQSAVQAHHKGDIATAYHIDQGKHFVGIMMLLSDLTEHDSHMRYLVGTHRLPHTAFRLKADDPQLATQENALEQMYPVFRLVGPKGTMFIYDNGNGIHKGNMIAGTVRNVMQATYSRGDHEIKPTDKDLMPHELQSAVAARAPIVRNAIRHII